MYVAVCEYLPLWVLLGGRRVPGTVDGLSPVTRAALGLVIHLGGEI